MFDHHQDVIIHQQTNSIAPSPDPSLPAFYYRKSFFLIQNYFILPVCGYFFLFSPARTGQSFSFPEKTKRGKSNNPNVEYSIRPVFSPPHSPEKGHNNPHERITLVAGDFSVVCVTAVVAILQSSSSTLRQPKK